MNTIISGRSINLFTKIIKKYDFVQQTNKQLKLLIHLISSFSIKNQALL